MEEKVYGYEGVYEVTLVNGEKHIIKYKSEQKSFKRWIESGTSIDGSFFIKTTEENTVIDMNAITTIKTIG